MLTVEHLQRTSWEAALQIQHERLRARREGIITDCLLITEHEPVITLGRATSENEATHVREVAARLNIPVHAATRGGKALWHGPGQLVGYPIINLRECGLGPLEYVIALEQALISVLQNMGIEATSRPGLRGVWVDNHKIGFIGIAVRGGISYHGFAINIENSLEVFNAFEACGIAGVAVTSIAQEVLTCFNRNDIERAVINEVMQILQSE